MAERGSYPHPVLDVSDDVTGTFEVLNVKVATSVEQVDLEFDISLDNDEILGLLDAEKCQIAARWKCTGTMGAGHADLHLSPGAPGRLGVTTSLPQDAIVGRVEVGVYIVACAPIDPFCLRSQNPEYGGAVFALAPGDVLAHGGDFAFDAQKSYDPMRPPLESCFRFHRSEQVKKYVGVDGTDTDYVDVLIPSALYDDFASQTLLPELQISSVVLPSVMEALAQYRERADEPVDGGWRATFKELVFRLKLDDKTLIEAGQEVLNDPLSKGLRKLNALVNDGDDLD